MANFPDLKLSNWQPTRDTIHLYSRILGKIRSTITPRQKHWWNISLRCSSVGLTTTPIFLSDLSKTFDLELDFISHKLGIRTSKAENIQIDLEGQSASDLAEDVLSSLSNFGIYIELDLDSFSNDNPSKYNHIHVENFWNAFSLIDSIFKEFKGTLREETSPVQVWPHHFDLAFLWFSGRLIPDQDPEDEENSDEQMNFGFSTGDEAITDPYFYINAYPLPDGLHNTKLPKGARWNEKGWIGGLLMYEELTKTDDPKSLLWDFLESMQNAGSKLMK